jgi:UDP-2,3-diacylglucosamine pyrophosphatase LpxH
MKSFSLNGKGAVKRKVDLVVISDVHLGTYGCHAQELSRYLKSIKPKTVVLNGDIVDMWQFNKRYWPKSHMKIIKQIISWATKGVKVYYITGNHDELLRKFEGFKLGSLSIENKLVLEMEGQKMWIFHGDVFDVTMQYSKWLTRLGAFGYDLLIVINAIVNFFSLKLGYGKISLSKKIKNSVKTAVKFINNFEKVCTDLAIEKGYDFVVCGHIHQPEIKKFANEKGSVTYLNSGDWVENLTALEYHKGAWSLYEYRKDELAQQAIFDEDEMPDFNTVELFSRMLPEFSMTPKSA